MVRSPFLKDLSHETTCQRGSVCRGAGVRVVIGSYEHIFPRDNKVSRLRVRYSRNAIGAVCSRVLGVVGALWPNATSACDQPYPPDENECSGGDCKMATKYQLEQAGIDDEHEFKTEYGAQPNSRFDICACKDGSIQIKAHGMCGRPRPSIPTYATWR